MKSKVRLPLVGLIGIAGLALPGLAQVINPPGRERVTDLLADSRRALEADPKLEYDPYTVLVRFDPGTSEQVKVFARIFVGGAYIRSFNNVPGLEQLRITASVPDAVEALSMIPGVEFAEPDYVVRLGASPDELGANARTDNAAAVGNANIVIADLDTGVNYSRPDLAASAWTNPGEVAGNGVDDDHNGYVDDVHGYDFYNHDADPMDDNGHGTDSVGAFVAPGKDKAGVGGANGHATIMAVKVLNSAGRGQISDAVLSLDYAVMMGGDVATSSWTGGSSSAAFTAALDDAHDKGRRVVGAAGSSVDGADRGVDGTSGVPGIAGGGLLKRDGLGAERGRPGPGVGGARVVQGRSPAIGSYNGRGANGRSNGERGVSLAGGSAQDLDISLGIVGEPVERFIPTIATYRYIQAAIDRSGVGRGVQVAGLEAHDGKVANGNNSVWFGVDFIADRVDQQQFIGGEISPGGGCLAYIDTSTSTSGAADLCFAVIAGNSYSVCRLPGVVRPGIRVSFQAGCRLFQGDWQLNPFHGPPELGDPLRVIRTSAVPLGASLSALGGSMIVAMHDRGMLPGVMASAPDLVANGAQAPFLSHGSFTGKLFAFEYHATTFVSTVAEFPQPTRAKVSLTFRGVHQDPVLTNRGTARQSPETLLVGPTGNQISSGVWLPPDRDALAGDLASVGAWVRHLGAGERCVAIVVGDSNSAAAEGGVVDALIQSVMTYYGGQAYDARPDVYWSATMNDNHSLRQYAGLGGRLSFGGDMSASPDDIALVSGFGVSLTYPFPAPQAPFTGLEWITYAGEAMHVQKPGQNSSGLLSAFCTSDTSDTGRWRLPNLYAVQNSADGAMNDSRSGHARLASAGAGLVYARSRMKAGDLVCLEAVLGQRTSDPGGSVQFAVRAQDGVDNALANGGRLVSATGGLSGSGWLTVDAKVNGVDAQREALARAYTGYAGQPLRPATMDVWSPPTTPLSGVGRHNFARVRTEPWVVGEVGVPGAGISIAPTPVSYELEVLLKRRTICSMFGLRIIGNKNPGQDHERLPWTVAMVGVGGSNATDQMVWLFSNVPSRTLRAAYWGNVLDCLHAGGAHVLFVHVESQNSRGQATGVPADALDDSSSTWAAYTGAKIRALHTLAERAGAASVCTIAVNSPRLTSDNALPRGEVLRGMAPLLDHCAAIDLFQVIGQRETQDAFWALNPYLGDTYDTAHPHYTLLGTAAIGNAFAAGIEADAAAGPH